MKVRHSLQYLGIILTVMTAASLRVSAQYSAAFDLKQQSDLYDERGFRQNKSITVDGKLIISNSNGNVSYSYPISSRTVNGYPVTVSLNYCGSVAFTAFEDRDAGADGTYAAWSKFTQNRPAWLLGVNGFAMQAISISSQFHSDIGKVSNSSTATATIDLEDEDLVWAIDGYDFCNRMANILTAPAGPVTDVIRLLRDDGSVLELTNVNHIHATYDPGTEDHFQFTGFYAVNEANAPGYAIVDIDTINFPQYMRWVKNGGQSEYIGVDTAGEPAVFTPRRVRYYPGDGLEYVFREWIIPFGMQPYADPNSNNGYDHGGTTAGPTICYLEAINSAERAIVPKFHRSRHNPGYGQQVGDTVYYPFHDTTKGRALVTGFDGHKFSYGSNWMAVEALGRTTVFWFNLLARSGALAGTESEMPLATLGYLTPESKVVATLPDNNGSQFISCLGYVTRIVDPEGRETTFEYESYSATYTNYGFPRDPNTNDVSITLRNYRLSQITEPTLRYDICYRACDNCIDAPESDLLSCEIEGEPEVELPALSSGALISAYALSNMVGKVEKSDCSGVLSTMTYNYQFLHPSQMSEPAGSYVTIHDNITDSVTINRYDYSTFWIPQTPLGYPPARFTALVETQTTGAGIMSKSVTSYERDSTAPYIIMPTVRNTSVALEEDTPIWFGKSGEAISYQIDVVRSFGDNDTMNLYFSRGVVRQTVEKRDTNNTILTSMQTDYQYLPRIDTSRLLMLHWNKFLTFKRFQYLVSVDSIRGRPEDFFFDRRVAVYTADLDSVGELNWTIIDPVVEWVSIPPIDRLEKTVIVMNKDGDTIAGVEREFRTDVVVASIHPPQAYTGDTLPVRGRVVKEYVQGAKWLEWAGGEDNYMTSRSTWYDYGSGTQLPASITNANGARSEMWFGYSLVDQLRSPESSAVVPMGSILLNNDSSYSKALVNSEYYARGFEQPLVERQLIRKYAPNGTLYIDTLLTLYERTVFGTPSGIVDANGWYSRFDYDLNGRLRTAWVPYDFPNPDADTIPYASTQRIVMKGMTVDSLLLGFVDCKTTGGGGVLDTTRTLAGRRDDYSGTLHAGLFVNPRPHCAVGDTLAAEKKGASIQDICCNPYTLSYEKELKNLGSIVYYPNAESPVSNIIALDSAFLLLMATSYTGECIHLSVIIHNLPDTVDSVRTFVLHCGETYTGGGQQTGTMQDGMPPQSIAAVEGNCQVSMTGVNYIHNLKVDLTDIRQYIQDMPYLRFTLRSTTVNSRVVFANDAEDTRPQLVLKGTFSNINQAADYTLNYSYNDDSLMATIAAKVDDERHTSNHYDASVQEGNTRRHTKVQHLFGADYRLKKSYAFIGPAHDPIRIDSTTTWYSGDGLKLVSRDQDMDSVQTRYDGLGRPIKILYMNGARDSIGYGFTTVAGALSHDHVKLDSLRGTADFPTAFLEYKIIYQGDTNGVTPRSIQFFDGWGRLQMEVADANSTYLCTSYDYDVLGRVIRVVNPNWDTTRYWYDAFGRVRYKQQPDLGTVSYAYDKVGNVRFTQTQSQADSNKLTFTEYDDLNRPTVIGEAIINTTGLDDAPADSSGLNLNRLTDRLDPTELHVAPATSILTANKTLWSTPTVGTPAFWAPVLLDSTTCPLNPEGLLGEDSNPVGPFLKHPVDYYTPTTTSALAHKFENLANYPTGGRIGICYDTLPPVSGSIWGGFPAHSQWDALAPHGTVRNLRGKEAAVAYREHGGEAYHFVVMSYDERGRVEALLRYTENLGFDAVYYTYNSLNQVTAVRVADPLRQYTTWYGYDNNGRVDSVWTWLTEADSGLGVAAPIYPSEPPRPEYADIVYDYTKTGQVSTMEYPEIQMLVSYAYNHRKWLDSMVATVSSSPAFRQVLSYDVFGQIYSQKWQHETDPQQEQLYYYDPLQRLTSWGTLGLGGFVYTYDAVGNRLSAISGDYLSSTYYTYMGTGPNQLSMMHHWVPGDIDITANYTYNPDGAITRIVKSITPNLGLPDVTTEKFHYSWRSLLQQYHHQHGVGAEQLWGYRYSAGGEREQKRLQMSRDEFHSLLPEKPWVYYLLGGSKEQLAVYHVQELDIPFCGTTLGYSAYAYPVEYNTFGGSAVRLTTRPDAIAANGVKEYPVTDHLGSTRLRVDQNGMIIDASDYEPFGKAITGEPRQGFIGKEKDLENGLGDFGVRKYDAEIGRFLSIDPLWEKYRAWTPYHYSMNSPLIGKDPNGKKVIPQNGTPEQLKELDETNSKLIQYDLDGLELIISGPVDVNLVFITEGNNEFDENSNTIYWNPNQYQLSLPSEKVLAPIMSYVHELGHGLQLAQAVAGAKSKGGTRADGINAFVKKFNTSPTDQLHRMIPNVLELDAIQREGKIADQLYELNRSTITGVAGGLPYVGEYDVMPYTLATPLAPSPTPPPSMTIPKTNER